ncbi:hypothetical protein EFR84_28245 [Rhizobium chutanense]|uniref:Uncharacterized protein n=1 Tax=Rhizobium chutanense TaxID=2035448 RepID=A0A3S0Q2Q8_9HYPH|nr:hypothetical protein EFR84_28245 [Rhizobium chutanense]
MQATFLTRVPALSNPSATSSSVMLGLEPSIHTAPTSSCGMGPRLKAEDDRDWGACSRRTRPGEPGQKV